MNRPCIDETLSAHTPESLTARLVLAGEDGVVLLRSGSPGPALARYSFVAAQPFLTFRSFGSRCELCYQRTGSESPGRAGALIEVQFGDPWRLLDSLMARYELLEELDLPFPLGGCFGYWGYELKNFVEPSLRRRALNDLELPDCHVGFFDSLVVFDHHLAQVSVVSTGLQADGSRSAARAQARNQFWQAHLQAGFSEQIPLDRPAPSGVESNVTQANFVAAVRRAQDYIRSGDIYQVNLSHRLAAKRSCSAWELFQRLATVSPAPFSAYLDCGDFQLASSSPELFLRLSGSHILSRPIKGTRPRSADPTRDAQLTYELQSSSKELAELVMITDLLRNDLGKVCEFGSVQVPELVRLERYPQVQHLVSTIEGRLNPSQTHFSAFASCFPGGSITGAPKFRAMEIIDELESVTRGPYTGALGYLGFNRESQLSIIIRTALSKQDRVYFQVGAGIVADSDPDAEYAETLAKGAGFFAALNAPALTETTSRQRGR